MRPIYYALAGAICGLLVVAIYGGVSGYFDGAGANHQYPPGLGAAILNAFILAVFYGPFVAACGALAGGCAGIVGLAVEKLLCGTSPQRSDR